MVKKNIDSKDTKNLKMNQSKTSDTNPKNIDENNNSESKVVDNSKKEVNNTESDKVSKSLTKEEEVKILEAKLDKIEQGIDTKKTSKLAITSFIFAFLFAPLGLLLSLITSVVLIVKKKTLKGWGWLIPALIISLIFTSVIVAIIGGGMYAYKSVNGDGISGEKDSRSFVDKLEDKAMDKIEEKAMEKVSDVMEDKMGNIASDITDNLGNFSHFEDADYMNEDQVNMDNKTN